MQSIDVIIKRILKQCFGLCNFEFYSSNIFVLLITYSIDSWPFLFAKHLWEIVTDIKLRLTLKVFFDKLRWWFNETCTYFWYWYLYQKHKILIFYVLYYFNFHYMSFLDWSFLWNCYYSTNFSNNTNLQVVHVFSLSFILFKATFFILHIDL